MSIINLAGTTRTLVAVGTAREPSIDCTTRAPTPRIGSTVDAPGVMSVGIGFTTGSAGLKEVLDVFSGKSIFLISGWLALTGVSTIAAGAVIASVTTCACCDLGIGGVPGFGELDVGALLIDCVPLKSEKKSHQALSTEDGSLW